MSIVLDELLRVSLCDRAVSYELRDALLYALSVGFGRDPLDALELPFVFERNDLRVVPTLAIPVSSLGLLKETGVDMSGVLHVRQSLELHRPLAASASLLVDSRVSFVFDRGEGRGALVGINTTARDAADGVPIFATTMTVLARKDGGFGGPAGETPPYHPIPDRAPDHTVSLKTRGDAALLYRLMGDFNPIHADPQLAQRAGFERPILHGLCTYGIAARAVILRACAGSVERIKELDARFSAPVIPGDEIVTDLWIDDDHVAFCCRVPERNAKVIDNGYARIEANT
jgi:acyl dehydratase